MRVFILILICFISLSSSGQIISASSPYRVRATASCSYLLDQYSGAAAAYSLRKLDADYAGSAIRVRRSSDNAEQDIGFTGTCGDLDTAALKTFVGTGGTDDGFVVTIYNQAGAENASQSDAAKQPAIIDNGVIYRQGGKPSIRFVSKSLEVASLELNTYIGVWIVGSTTANGMFAEHSTNAFTNGNGFFFYGSNNSSWLVARGGSNQNATGVANWPSSNLGIFSFLYNGTGEYYDNGSAESNGTVSGSAIGNSAYTSTLYIYSRASNTLGITGYLSEFILWDSDQDANRAAIESAINSYYSIY